MSENYDTDADSNNKGPSSSMDAQKIIALVSSLGILVGFVVFWYLQISDVISLLNEVYG